MVKREKPTVMVLTALVMFALTFPVFAGGSSHLRRGESHQSGGPSSEYVWIVYTFDFPCPQTNRNKKIAYYELSWSDDKKPITRTERCSTIKSNPMYNGLGFVVRIELNKPASSLRVGPTQNCTAGRILQREPDEYNNDRYKRIHLSWY